VVAGHLFIIQIVNTLYCAKRGKCVLFEIMFHSIQTTSKSRHSPLQSQLSQWCVVVGCVLVVKYPA